MIKTKNFSFSDFMTFSESLVDSLEAVSNKIEEVTNQINTLETVLEGGGDDSVDNTETEVPAEENVAVEEENIEEAPVAEDIPAAEEPVVEEGIAEETEVTPEPTSEDSADAPVSEEDNDSAAIDAMSTGDENFSEFVVVGLKNRPWGNRVIAAKDFSEKEHRKLIPTTFSTKAQAQRALTSYNVNGENFSIRYQHATQTQNSASTTVNMSESANRYQNVKNIFGM